MLTYARHGVHCRYNTTRYGKPAVGESMVCCVFVCHMWKAGGIFGENGENCGEFTNAYVAAAPAAAAAPRVAVSGRASPLSSCGCG